MAAAVHAMDFFESLFPSFGRTRLLRALGKLAAACNMTAGTITSAELPAAEVAELNALKRERMKRFRAQGPGREPLHRVVSISLETAALYAEKHEKESDELEGDALLAEEAAARWDDPLVAVSLAEHAVCEVGVFLGDPANPDAYVRAANGEADRLIEAFARLQLFAYFSDPAGGDMEHVLKNALGVLIGRGQRVAREPKHYFDLGILERERRFPDLDAERVLFPRRGAGLVIFHKLEAQRILGAGSYGVVFSASPRRGFGSPFGAVALKVQLLTYPIAEDITGRLELRVQAELTKFFFPLRFASDDRVACVAKLLDFDAGVATDLTGWAAGAGRFATFEKQIKDIAQESRAERALASAAELCLGSLDFEGRFATGPHLYVLAVVAQVAATLVVLQRELRFVHNDSAPRNLLRVQPANPGAFFSFALNDRYVNVPAAWSEGTLVKLNDFGFSHLEVGDLRVFHPDLPDYTPSKDLHQLACEIIMDAANWCKDLRESWLSVDPDLKRLLGLMLSVNAWGSAEVNMTSSILFGAMVASEADFVRTGFYDRRTGRFKAGFYDELRETARQMWNEPYSKQDARDETYDKEKGYPNVILPHEIFEHPKSPLTGLIGPARLGLEVNRKNPAYDHTLNVKAKHP